MSDSANWFARKLGPPAQQQAPQQRYVPPPQPVQYQQPQQPVQYQQPQPQQQEITGEQIWAAVKAGQIDPVTGLLEGAKRWKGGKGVKTETQPCPECGSQHYYSRSSGSKMDSSGRRVPPAPICMDCGYNGMYVQFGVQEGEG